MSLYFAIGGGGDVVMAAALADKDDAIAQIPWERFVVDPNPGPVPPDSLREVRQEAPHLYLANHMSYVERGGRVFKTQGMCVAEALGTPVYLVNPYAPVSEVAKSLSRFKKVVGVDVGGDVLGVGCEETIGSPLSDAYGLAVLTKLEDMGVEVELWVMSPGADGELDREYILKRAAEVARRGGLVGTVGLGPRQIERLRLLVSRCFTEASAVAVRAASGEYGVAELRGGFRKVKIDLFSAFGIRLRPRQVQEINRAAQIIYKSDATILQAAELLISAGIPTEYHLEELLHRGATLQEAASALSKKKRCLPPGAT